MQADVKEAKAATGAFEFKVTPLGPYFAGRVDGVDLTKPFTPAQIAAFRAAMDKYAVLVFSGQTFNDEEQVAFAEQFGRIEDTPTLVDQERRRLANMKINDISNLNAEGELFERNDRRRMYNLGNMLWHSNSSFKATPALYSMLHARKIPPVPSNTEFVDTRVAWDHLPDDWKAEIKDLVTDHSLIFSRGAMGFEAFSPAEQERCTPVPQRLVRRVPGSNRLAVYLSAHIGTIHGIERPEALNMIRDLTEFATQRQFVYSHHWTVGDLVIWDNRATMHRATRFDDKKYPRDLRRVTIEDSAPTLDQPV